MTQNKFSILFWLSILFLGVTKGISLTFQIADSAAKQLEQSELFFASYWMYSTEIIIFLLLALALFSWLNKKPFLFYLLTAGIFFIFDYHYNDVAALDKYYFSVCFFIFLLFALFLGLTKRLFAAIIFTLIAIVSISLISYTKEYFFDSPFSFGDTLFFIKNFEANFKLAFVYPWALFFIIFLLFTCIAILYFFIKFETPLITGENTKVWVSQILIVILSLTALYSYRPLSDFKNKVGTHDKVMDFVTFLNNKKKLIPLVKYDPIYRILAFIHYKNFSLEIPPRINSEKFFADIKSINNDVNVRPDIMMVLAESTFDPVLVGTCIDKECNHYAQMAESAFRSEQAPLLVHIIGGRTWLSEFAFITGFDYRFFPTSGMYTPMVVSPKIRKTLVTHLKQLGYRTVAVYPIDGDFLNARSIYKSYGFDEFYSLKELSTKVGKDQSASKWKNWNNILDSDVYDNALAISSRPDDKRPVFIFVLTIRNHSPWSGAVELNLNKIFNDPAPDPALADYVDKLKDTDNAFTTLMYHWLSSKRPRILGWFGDHQPHTVSPAPPLPNHSMDSRIPEEYKQYASFFTYYGLFANYQGRGTKKDAQALDIAFLSQKLLQFAELPLPDDLAYAYKVINECKGVLFYCAKQDWVHAYISRRIYQDAVFDLN